MDFNEAIQAHASWKMKLKLYLNQPDGSIDASKLEKDDACVLGCWLHGEESSKYRKEPKFNDLIREHKTFHKAAADIVRKKHKGEDISEEVALGATSEFSKSSAHVIDILMDFKRKS
jgi:hypothetical protein